LLVGFFSFLALDSAWPWGSFSFPDLFVADFDSLWFECGLLPFPPYRRSPRPLILALVGLERHFFPSPLLTFTATELFTTLICTRRSCSRAPFFDLPCLSLFACFPYFQLSVFPLRCETLPPPLFSRILRYSFRRGTQPPLLSRRVRVCS